MAYVASGEYPEILKLRVEMLIESGLEDCAINLCSWCLRSPTFTNDLFLKKTQLLLMHKTDHEAFQDEVRTSHSRHSFLTALSSSLFSRRFSLATLLSPLFSCRFSLAALLSPLFSRRSSLATFLSPLFSRRSSLSTLLSPLLAVGVEVRRDEALFWMASKN